MAKLFSLASWNIEHFGKPWGDAARAKVKKVVEFIKIQNPDVIGIYEVESSEIYGELVNQMPGYTYHITEGDQAQEILVGIRNGFTAFITQKLEFKSGDTFLRPGVLLTINIDGQHFPILFLHTKSGNDARGFGLRDDMLSRALKFRKVMQKAGTDNYIVVGDLNTMGMSYPYGHSIDAKDEIKRMSNKAKGYYDMRPLTKTNQATFSNGSTSSIPPSELDHVFAAETMKFTVFDTPKGKGEVDVRGWADFTDVAGQDKWIKEFSDHCLLYLEVLDQSNA
ncbi:MAG: hypothetical protein H6577_10290 [Lewinellaceae bacterium]|nr:hypothetical protein [Saprospiraceae bacterium]MCB9338505.1 hypothetical protein [Lewinellaceae bacterium]